MSSLFISLTYEFVTPRSWGNTDEILTENRSAIEVSSVPWLRAPASWNLLLLHQAGLQTGILS